MSRSVILKSSIVKKYWMALTGLFLCLFLVGHLLGNLQLFAASEEGRRAFNEYGYFMGHNIFIKILSYLTYISILFHAIDGILLTVQNKKARPINYVKNNAGANSSLASRSMAILGSIILIFIVTHMANFWWVVKMSSKQMPLHSIVYTDQKSGMSQDLYITHSGNMLPTAYFESSEMAPAQMKIKNGTEFYSAEGDLLIGEGYKDMHSLVYAFFGHDKTKYGFPENKLALWAVIGYVISMLVLAYHLMHGFASAFQSLGLRHPAYTKLIKGLGTGFAIIIPLLFAIIPIYIYLTK
ncbi:MAG: succinate dehydrogenase cytochrome b subunit [Bacteroidetes bacterium]|nr:MAG: succinate dehydrogenase cytochrome b subunit [Bacteroidota bacterium]